MKLHEIQCHFSEVPHAVTEYGLRRRPRTSRIVLVVVLVLVLDTVSSNFFTNLLFSRTSTRTSTKRIKLNHRARSLFADIDAYRDEQGLDDL